MQTNIYFVRHAEPDYENHNDRLRDLTAKGAEDAKKLADYFMDKNIDMVLSSPYRRAVNTVQPFARAVFMPIVAVEDFCERAVADEWIADWNEFSKNQWKDFNYKLPGGESLNEVKERVIRGFEWVLAQYKGKNVVVGSHGTALAVLLNYLDPAFGYEQLKEMTMPWVVCVTEDNDKKTLSYCKI